MKIKMTTIFSLVLLLPLISFVVDTDANEVEIKVTHWDFTIEDNLFSNRGFTKPITDALDGYHWMVNNQEYYFTTSLIDPAGMILNDDRWYLDPYTYDVHIVDGESPDTFFAPFSQDVKNKFIYS